MEGSMEVEVGLLPEVGLVGLFVCMVCAVFNVPFLVMDRRTCCATSIDTH